jgi:hypothetical protein
MRPRPPGRMDAFLTVARICSDPLVNHNAYSLPRRDDPAPAAFASAPLPTVLYPRQRQ